MHPQKKKHLELLAEKYPTMVDVLNRMVNLKALRNLPKGTEHFISDIHGENEAFYHILRNASGVIRSKIDDLFSKTVSAAERRSLAALIYYPAEKLERIKAECPQLSEWYKITLYRLLELIHFQCIKYSRAYVSRAIEPEFKNILEELIYGIGETDDRRFYYEGLIDSIIEIDHADACIIAMSNLISRLAVDRLHVIGDIYDRGPGADIVIDDLMAHHNVDIQWGNHDIIWMGAAAGSDICIANVIRMCARYDNLHTLEEGYGITLRPLLSFAADAYRDDPCEPFRPKHSHRDAIFAGDYDTLAKLHKAMAIIQFKLEGQAVRRHPEYGMEYKMLLHRVDRERAELEIDGVVYPMKDALFPTADPADPYALTEAEQLVMERLREAFFHSERLNRHVRFLFAKGAVYKCYNGNLMYHGCIPMNEDGTFAGMRVQKGVFGGKALLDYADATCRYAYFSKKGAPDKEDALDFIWYLWTGPLSPLYGKDKMTTFERYFIEDKTPWHEKKNPYYDHIEDPAMCDKILGEFGLGGEDSHILSGHMPVNKGSSPIHGGGKLLIIDGGFAKAYQKKTGIAGYTLIYNSWGMMLAAHTPFESKQQAIEQEEDIQATTVLVQRNERRCFIRDTDKGAELQEQIEDLEELKNAYIQGHVKERS